MIFYLETVLLWYEVVQLGRIGAKRGCRGYLFFGEMRYANLFIHLSLPYLCQIFVVAFFLLFVNSLNLFSFFFSPNLSLII